MSGEVFHMAHFYLPKLKYRSLEPGTLFCVSFGANLALSDARHAVCVQSINAHVVDFHVFPNPSGSTQELDVSITTEPASRQDVGFCCCRVGSHGHCLCLAGAPLSIAITALSLSAST